MEKDSYFEDGFIGSLILEVVEDQLQTIQMFDS